MNPDNTFLQIHFNIIHLRTARFRSDLFPSGVRIKILYAFLVSPCPSHLIFLDLVNLMIILKHMSVSWVYRHVSMRRDRTRSVSTRDLIRLNADGTSAHFDRASSDARDVSRVSHGFTTAILRMRTAACDFKQRNGDRQSAG